jgi:hypothetical protein
MAKNIVLSVADVSFEFVSAEVVTKHSFFKILKLMVVHCSTNTDFDIVSASLCTQYFR